MGEELRIAKHQRDRLYNTKRALVGRHARAAVCCVTIMKMIVSKFIPFQFSDADVSRIVEMAWEDRTPFEAIETGFWDIRI